MVLLDAPHSMATITECKVIKGVSQMDAKVLWNRIINLNEY